MAVTAVAVGTERARRIGRRFIMFDNIIVILGGYMVFPLVSLHFVDHLGWAAAAVGLALGVRIIFQQGLGMVGGSLADRFGAKPVIVCGMLLRAAGFAVMAVAHNPALLVLSCLLGGLGGTLFEPARSALIVKLTRPQERDRFYSLLMVQDNAAAMAGALLGSWLLVFDFFWVAMGGCLFFVAAAIANLLLLPAWKVAAGRTEAMVSMRVALSDKPFMLYALTLGGYFVLGAQIVLLLPMAVTQASGSAQAVGWLYTLNGVLVLGLLYPLARWSERRYSLEARVLAGLGLMTASLAAMSVVGSMLLTFAVLGVFFVGMLVTEPARETLLARFVKPSARGSYMGLGRIGSALGGLVGMVGGGALHDYALVLGQPGLPWLVLALTGALTFWGLYLQFYPRGTGRGQFRMVGSLA